MPLKIAFVCDYHEALRSTVLPLSAALVADGEYEPHVILQRATETMVEMCANNGISYTCRGRAPSPSRNDQRPAAPPSAVSWSTKLVLNAAKAKRRIGSLVEELERLRPAAVVFLDDRTLLTSRWVRAAQLLEVPTVVVQWAAVHRAATMLSLRAAQQQTFVRPRAIAWIEDRIAHLVPQAVAHHEGHRVWFLSADQVLAGWITKSFPQTAPWSFGGGNADVVTAMGRGWKERMIAGGVPEEKIVVTGHPDQDHWLDVRRQLDQRRSALLDELGVSAERRLITVVAPALAMRRGRGSRCGDISVEEIQVSLRAAVTRIIELGRGFVPVVKVHPRDRLADLNFLRSCGEQVVVVRECDTAELIAASDAMACQWSTTAMIGQAMGTPVAVFDFYKSPSAEMWSGIQSLPVARNNRELTKLLTDLLCSASYRSNLVDLEREFVDEYLCLDGGCTERLVNLVKQTASGATRACRQAA